jgi:signal peptidase I
VEIGVGAICLAIGLHTFALLGLVGPVRISAGSMSPHWLGPHWEAECLECGTTHAVGIDARPQAGRVLCPSCGAVVLLHTAPQRDGDSLLVDRARFHFLPPRRWDAVVFRCPTNASHLCLKRVVGLPTERISLVDGDVYANGRIVRKSLSEQRALRIPVHDGARARRQWQPSSPSSSWTIGAGNTPVFSFVPTRKPSRHSKLDLLTYLPPDEASTTDWLAYNAGIAVIANPTADLMLTGRFVLRGVGSLFIRCGGGPDALWVELDCARGRLRLTQRGKHVGEVDCARLSHATQRQHASDLELSLFDRQLILALDEGIAVRRPLQRPIAPSAAPFAIASQNLFVRIEDLALWRDVVYTPAPGSAVASDAVRATWQLAAGEYFVMGDNPAISDDSRTWRGGAGLPRKLIVGRAIDFD